MIALKAGQDRYKKGSKRGGQWKPKNVPDGTPKAVAQAIMTSRKATAIRIKLRRKKSALSKSPNNPTLKKQVKNLSVVFDKLNSSAKQLRKDVKKDGYGVDSGGKIKTKPPVSTVQTHTPAKNTKQAQKKQTSLNNKQAKQNKKAIGKPVPSQNKNVKTIATNKPVKDKFDSEFSDINKRTLDKIRGFQDDIDSFSGKLNSMTPKKAMNSRVNDPAYDDLKKSIQERVNLSMNGLSLGVHANEMGLPTSTDSLNGFTSYVGRNDDGTRAFGGFSNKYKDGPVALSQKNAMDMISDAKTLSNNAYSRMKTKRDALKKLSIQGNKISPADISDFADARAKHLLAESMHKAIADNSMKFYAVDRDGNVDNNHKPSHSIKSPYKKIPVKKAPVKSKTANQPTNQLPPFQPKPMAGVPAPDKYGWYDFHPSLPRDTMREHTTSRGTFTKARQKLHNDIINEMFKGKSPVPAGKDKISTMMMGLPGSGKSTLVKSLNQNDNHTVTVDPDSIREKLPEYQEGLKLRVKNAASITHSEAMYIAEKARQKVVNDGYNLRVDGTGANYRSYSNTMNTLRNNGHKIRLVMVDMDLGKAQKGVSQRARATGRFIPDWVMSGSAGNIPSNFSTFSSQADEYVVADATNNWPPKVVATKGEGDAKPNILDKKYMKNTSLVIRNKTPQSNLSVPLSDVLSAIENSEPMPEYDDLLLRPGEEGVSDPYSLTEDGSTLEEQTQRSFTVKYPW